MIAHTSAASTPRAEQSHRRQPQRLLVALGGGRRERARHHAAHVHHVRRHHDPRDQLVAEEDRALHHHVLRVQAAAVVRVVGQEHVCGAIVSPWRSMVERTACAAAPKWNSICPAPTTTRPSASSSVHE